MGTNTGQPRAVAVGACANTFPRSAHAGSDSAILAAVASGRFSELLVVRGLRWIDEPVRIGRCRIRMVRPPMGQAWTAGPMIRRDVGRAPVPVWSEPSGLELLNGFCRAAVSSLPNETCFGSFAELLRQAQTRETRMSESNRDDDAASTIVVLSSHPCRLDARAVMFAASLAAVSGFPTRVILPRGTRNVDSAIRYAKRLELPVWIEVCEGPSWLVAAQADAVFLDRKHESSTTFGPSLIALAEALGIAIIDVPGSFAVGERDARRYGQPLLAALIHKNPLDGVTVSVA